VEGKALDLNSNIKVETGPYEALKKKLENRKVFELKPLGLA